MIKGAICLYLINFDPHRIHIYNIVISPLVMSAKCVSPELSSHLSVYYIYVVVVAFEVLADVINIVNYSFNAHWLKDEGAVNDFCFFFFFAEGGGGVEDYFIALSLSLLDLIQHLYRCILELRTR